MNRVTKLFSSVCVASALLVATMPAGFAAETMIVVRDFRPVAKSATPAVVSIRVEIQQKSQSLSGGSQDPWEMFGDGLWEQFFNMPKQQKKPSTSRVVGQGSGFIISEDGYILTNSHIVHKADKITVTLNNGKEYEAKTIGDDSNTDVALIKIEEKNLPYLKMADSDRLEVGQNVAAIGNPLGLQATLTTGVVSAKGRNNLGLTPFEDFIQTDAAINRGNSGGPLLDLDGEVIGINTAIATQTGGYMGIGFAIPSNMARHVMEQILNNGMVTRGYIGVLLQKIDGDLAKAFKLKDMGGALIAEVVKKSPAEEAGLKPGDVILKYDGKKIKNIGALRNAISMVEPDSKLRLDIKREDKIIPITITVGTYPSKMMPTGKSYKESKLGIHVEDLTSSLAKNLGYAGEEGVVVTKVKSNSLAARGGIQKGSVILEVNRKKVTNIQEFHDAVEKTEEGQPILLLVKQGEITRFVSIKG